MLQFEWTVSLGQVLTMLTVVAAVSVMRFEHVLMWRDYKNRHGINGSPPTPCAAHVHFRSTDITREMYDERDKREEL